MAGITIGKERDENGMPVVYVGKEKIDGIISLEAEAGYYDPARITMTVLLGSVKIKPFTGIPGSGEKKEMEPGKFAFKEGISNDSIQ